MLLNGHRTHDRRRPPQEAENAMGELAEQTVSWRAAQIKDPVRRLRYLRDYGIGTERAPRLRRSAIVFAALSILFLVPLRAVRTAPVRRPPLEPGTPPAPARVRAPRVWMVESTDQHDLYSNGLRIDNGHRVPHQPRRYRIFTATGERVETKPSGTVFHSTESHIVPFGPEHNEPLREAGESVLAYVRRNRSYHFLIDRFGRVFRIVAEADAAAHAGRSAWSVGEGLCLNLNHAFFGIAFEARTGEPLSPPQIHAGRTLTEALRGVYGIADHNCVTHAQVSLNPANMRVGWHTDFARGFPFADLGLPNNYERPLASVSELGFEFDATYLDAAGEGLWIGVHRSEARLKADAAAQGLGPAEWRRKLERRYRDLARKGQ